MNAQRAAGAPLPIAKVSAALPKLPIRALQFAAERHAGQFRADGVTPYVMHPYQVVEVLCRHGYLESAVLAAAALHDVVEDTDTPLDEINERFGPRVAKLVGWMTDEPGLSGYARHAAQLKKIIAAPYDAQAIKLADRYCNVYDAIHFRPAQWSDEKVFSYLQHGRMLADELLMPHAGLARDLLSLVKFGITNLMDSSRDG